MQALTTIDGIEHEKMRFYQATGSHINITPRQHSVVMVITDTPIAPVMLPIKKHTKIGKAFDTVKVKVNRKK